MFNRLGNINDVKSYHYIWAFLKTIRIFDNTSIIL